MARKKSGRKQAARKKPVRKKTSRKKTSRARKKAARAAPVGAPAPAAGHAGVAAVVANVPRNRVGAAVQAMISFEAATHVEAVEDAAGTFTVTRIA